MLVGDVILSAREAVPDLPGVLPAPTSGNITFALATSAVPLPAGNHYLQASFVNPWGETSVGAEVLLAVPAGGAIQATWNYLGGVVGLTGITAINVYVGSTSGGENQLYQLNVSTGTVTFLLDGTLTPVGATPPLGNSAFLPDSGGYVAGAGQVYRWLSDALNRLSSLNGGIPDFSGFGTLVSQANYTVPGDWQSMSAAWYDGYPLFLGSSELVFRHNTITAISGMMSFTQVADTLVVELFAQPVRTAGIDALTVALSATGTVAQGGGAPNWTLPFGLARIGQLPNYEIVTYTANGPNYMGLIRGLGGTNATAWPVGTPLYELNCMFKGMRAAQLYSPGMALNTLRLPSSWVPLMHLYLLARYRRIEQQEQEAGTLMKAFEEGAKEATRKKPALGDRQIQPQDDYAADVYPLLGSFGGALIP